MAPTRPGPSRRRVSSLDVTILSDFVGWASSAPEKLDDLYESPHATQCVLRALPPLARLYVCRVLFLPATEPAFSPSLFRSALQRRTRARDRHNSSLSTLRALRVFVDPQPRAPSHPVEEDNGNPGDLALNPIFAKQLRKAVTCQVDPVFGGQLRSPSRFTSSELDNFSAERLERVLNFAIGNPGSGADPSAELQQALESTGILCPCDGGNALTISSTGFQFLLKDPFSQVWVVLRDIINNRFSGFELEALNFVFQLSFASCGPAYSLQALSEPQYALIAFLDELGIVALDSSASCFYATRFGVSLVASITRSSADCGLGGNPIVSPVASSRGDIKIIVETNFRLYAYTTSGIQMKVLGLFTHMRYQLPNLVVGHLTREKAREALMNGISADQMIGFLNSHAHPRMKGGVVPSNVCDEIRLWEAEQERVQFVPGFLLRDFESAASFERVLTYAGDIGACLWSDSVRRQVIVVKEEYDKIRSFIRSQ